MGLLSPTFEGMGLPFSMSAVSSFFLSYGVFLYTCCEYQLICFSDGISIMLSVPLKRPPMYCSFLEAVSPCWYHTFELPFKVFGPCGLGKEVKPLPLATNIFVPTIFIFVG